jgi:hypothetical protein
MATQQLLDYVRQQLAAGVPTEQVKNALKAQGWNEQDINEGIATSVSNLQPKSLWAKAIPRTNWAFMVTSLLLVFGLDLLILLVSPSLWPFWAEMLTVLGVFVIFFCLENFLFKKKFSGTKSHLDPWISTIISVRNIIFLLNFIPFIQLLGMSLIGAFVMAVPSVILGGRGLSGAEGITLGLALFFPAMMVAYIVLIVRRFSSIKKQS